MIKIGVSPRLLHPQPGARGVHTRVLHYLEDALNDLGVSEDELEPIDP